MAFRSPSIPRRREQRIGGLAAVEHLEDDAPAPVDAQQAHEIVDLVGKELRVEPGHRRVPGHLDRDDAPQRRRLSGVPPRGGALPRRAAPAPGRFRPCRPSTSRAWGGRRFRARRRRSRHRSGSSDGACPRLRHGPPRGGERPWRGPRAARGRGATTCVTSGSEAACLRPSSHWRVNRPVRCSGALACRRGCGGAPSAAGRARASTARSARAHRAAAGSPWRAGCSSSSASSVTPRRRRRLCVPTAAPPEAA